jgi:hypothetical protein
MNHCDWRVTFTKLPKGVSTPATESDAQNSTEADGALGLPPHGTMARSLWSALRLVRIEGGRSIGKTSRLQID